ncbi:hypothetical protein H0O00_04825 [Candidatus Micrarchaeota archaeon]|nr:hypothetical protein [Candidatus Micrarchaeota archaeon]
MAGANVKGRGIVVPDAPVLAMANRFQIHAPETEKAVRKVEVVEDETLEKMKKAWKKCNYNYDWSKYYSKMLEIAKRLRYSAKDVENFSLALVEFQGEKRFSEKAGLFLSALINNSKDTVFVIHTAHFAESINHIGYLNTKNITVEGNAGDYVGGLMTSGTITVEGDAGKKIGWLMKRGIITVKGDAGECVGSGMKDGKIYVNGEIGGISDEISHGKIYHKGELIVDM